jgi:hypothetical protein
MIDRFDHGGSAAEHDFAHRTANSASFVHDGRPPRAIYFLQF